MYIVIYADVHGDIFALNELYRREQNNADLFISLGDMIGYLPYGFECINFIKERKDTVALIGNHEKMFLIGKCADACSQLAKTFYAYNQIDLQKCDREFINNMLFSYVYNDILFIHTLSNRYIYSNSKIDQLISDTVIGHSHRPFYRKDPQSGFALINVGSLGQNRDCITVCNYVVLETDYSSYNFKSFYRNPELLIQSLKQYNFPSECIQYYSRG